MRVSSFILSVLLLASCSQVREITWQKHVIDGHMTGVTAPTADNVPEALGTVEDGRYIAPNGKVFDSGAVPSVASAMIDVQPRMVSLKEVIGHSPREMVKHKPESELSNMIADALILQVAEISGKKVDVSIINMGGIRIDMPCGDVLLDDVSSMLPFRNNVCYVLLEGRDLRAIFEQFAREGIQAVGGVKLVYSAGKLESAEVGGKTLDDDMLYGVATVDFLLDGGDNIKVAKNARELVVYDELVKSGLEKYIRRLTAEGREIEYSKDGRVVCTK